ncbi:MAG: hypothetical protein ACT4TC_07830 [Myxococcaceae bacterium]
MEPRHRNQETRMQIETSIQRRLQETGAALFVPEQFIDEGLGSTTEVLTALRGLEDDGYLRARANLRCAYNHELWGGRPDEIPAYAATMRCSVPSCPSQSIQEEEQQDEDFQPYVVLRYQISPAWMAQLGQKKRSAPANAA